MTIRELHILMKFSKIFYRFIKQTKLLLFFAKIHHKIIALLFSFHFSNFVPNLTSDTIKILALNFLSKNISFHFNKKFGVIFFLSHLRFFFYYLFPFPHSLFFFNFFFFKFSVKLVFFSFVVFSFFSLSHSLSRVCCVWFTGFYRSLIPCFSLLSAFNDRNQLFSHLLWR